MKSSIGLFYQITVTDKNGKVVRKTRLRRSKSWCIAFLQLMEAQMRQEAVTITPIDGSPQAIDEYAYNFACNGAIGGLSYGIILGTGTTTPANDDYIIETIIAHGSGAGQLNYAAVSFIAAQEVEANVDLQILRSAQNLSGSPINVTEAGIYGRASTIDYVLLIHDVFTAVPVADGQTITVTYTLRTTV